MFVDIFNVRTESEFYEKLAAEVIRQTATTFNNVLSAVKKYASAIVSGLSFGDAAAPTSIQFQIREPQQCARIVELADNNPYYVQQLSQTAWLHTGDGVCTDDVVREAFEDILRQQGELNRALTATLTISQQSLLHAMAEGEKSLSSRSVMEKYGLKSTTEISRARKALVARDILDDFGKVYTFEDPLYEYWLKNVYFRR